eukprot:545230-Pyramimonas_sp.AAC.1
MAMTMMMMRTMMRMTMAVMMTMATVMAMEEKEKKEDSCPISAQACQAQENLRHGRGAPGLDHTCADLGAGGCSTSSGWSSPVNARLKFLGAHFALHVEAAISAAAVGTGCANHPCSEPCNIVDVGFQNGRDGGVAFCALVHGWSVRPVLGACSIKLPPAIGSRALALQSQSHLSVARRSSAIGNDLVFCLFCVFASFVRAGLSSRPPQVAPVHNCRRCVSFRSHYHWASAGFAFPGLLRRDRAQ